MHAMEVDLHQAESCVMNWPDRDHRSSCRTNGMLHYEVVAQPIEVWSCEVE